MPNDAAAARLLQQVGATDYDRNDLACAGRALVQLDAWCRQRGLDDLATLIEFAADWADARLCAD